MIIVILSLYKSPIEWECNYFLNCIPTVIVQSAARSDRTATVELRSNETASVMKTVTHSTVMKIAIDKEDKDTADFAAADLGRGGGIPWNFPFGWLLY